MIEHRFTPDDFLNQGDAGFDGAQHDYVNVKVFHKNLNGGKLTAQQEENRALAKERVMVEQACLMANAIL